MAQRPKGVAMESGLTQEIDLNEHRHWKVMNKGNEILDTYPTHQKAMQERPPLHWLQAESDDEVRARLAQ